MQMLEQALRVPTVRTWNPVDWSGNTVSITSLEGIDHTENLGGVATGRSWV